jgi:2-keto-4-pentenoate hydratase/2-oxohepta-3-ene-1,7-dioic acid hydratase in catechol pathway
MRLYSIKTSEGYVGAIANDDRIITLSDLNGRIGTTFPTQVLEIIRSSDLTALRTQSEGWIAQIGRSMESVEFSAPFYNPPKILGIGLNYHEHAVDLGAEQPSEPATFMKPRTTIIGPRNAIVLPPQSKRVTAEAELGIVIGKRCKHVGEIDADSVIFGYYPALDMTAEDILQRNPRFLTRAKSFDTFLSFGPVILTADEISGDLSESTITTVLNGKSIRSNRISNMRFSPHQLVSFLSDAMTLEPGDLILTGTPGAVAIKDGDVVECRIDGFPTLSNPVVKEK